MSILPHVIVHIGDSFYLRDIVELNAKSNPVVILGCEKNAYLKTIPNVTHFDYKLFMTPYADRMREHFYALEKGLEKNILNDVDPTFSTFSNGTCQFLWMLRVFLLKQFMEKANLTRIFHTDSDCFMFENATDLAQHLELGTRSAITIEKIHDDIHMVGSIHNAFLTLDFCNAFLQLYEDIYINQSKRYLLTKMVDAFLTGKNHGNVCDMTLYYLLWKEKLVEIVDLTEPFVYKEEPCVFDLNVKNPSGFLGPHTYFQRNYLTHTMKAISYENKKVYQFTVRSEIIRLLSAHFNADAKHFIATFRSTLESDQARIATEGTGELENVL